MSPRADAPDAVAAAPGAVGASDAPDAADAPDASDAPEVNRLDRPGTDRLGAGRPDAGRPQAGRPEDGVGQLLSIGAAAARAGVTERSLRYYQELGLLVPSARTKGGMRRYSEDDLERVARIRELQTVVGLNLDEVADVLRGEGRLAELRAAYRSGGLTAGEQRQLAEECLTLALDLRQVVEAKRHAIEAFTADLDARIDRIKAALAEADTFETVAGG